MQPRLLPIWVPAGSRGVGLVPDAALVVGITSALILAQVAGNRKRAPEHRVRLRYGACYGPWVAGIGIAIPFKSQASGIP